MMDHAIGFGFLKESVGGGLKMATCYHAEFFVLRVWRLLMFMKRLLLVNVEIISKRWVCKLYFMWKILYNDSFLHLNWISTLLHI